MEKIINDNIREYKQVYTKEQVFDNSFIFRDITDISQIEKLQLGDSIRLANKKCNVILDNNGELKVCINFRYGDGPKQYSKRHLRLNKLKYLYECYTNTFDIDNKLDNNIRYKEILSYNNYINDDMKYKHFDLERMKNITENQSVMLYNDYFTIRKISNKDTLYIHIRYYDKDGNKKHKRHTVDRLIYDYYKYMYYKYVKNV